MSEANKISDVFSDNSFSIVLIQSLIDMFDDMIWIMSEDGKILLYNQSFQRFFKIKRQKDIEDELPLKLKPGRFDKTNPSSVRSIVEKEEANIKNESFIIEKHNVLHNETLFIIGRAYRNTGSGLYISDYVYLKALMDNIPFQIYFKDLNSKFTLINKKQAEVLGISNPEEALGKSDFDYFTYDHAQKAYEDEQKIIKTGKPIILETERIRSKEGDYIWMNATKAAIRDQNNKPIGTVGISYDVTEKVMMDNQLRIAKQKAEESDHLKTAFLANMSHEIRTPMNGIIGFINLLKEQDISEPERAEFFNHIESCTHTLLHLIDDIIDIAKIESGQINIENEDTDITKLVTGLMKTFEETTKKSDRSNLNLYLQMPDSNEEIILYTDPQRVRQILMNLVNNAIKYTEEGFVKLGFDIQDEKLQFYVMDTGIGIPDDKKDIIFKRFGQANQSIYLSKKGTGLGLSISKNLVELLGGEIWFESEENKGSTFYFTLPMHTQKEKKDSVL